MFYCHPWNQLFTKKEIDLTKKIAWQWIYQFSTLCTNWHCLRLSARTKSIPEFTFLPTDILPTMIPTEVTFWSFSLQWDLPWPPNSTLSVSSRPTFSWQLMLWWTCLASTHQLPKLQVGDPLTNITILGLLLFQYFCVSLSCSCWVSFGLELPLESLLCLDCTFFTEILKLIGKYFKKGFNLEHFFHLELSLISSQGKLCSRPDFCFCH